ncbi:MAG: hypothetical protein KJ646_05315 [Nanoarchaeota archaeon]|nr:hypothetical protein [Nanoarchaeota archaeon]
MAIAKRKKKFFEVEIPLINKQTPLLAFEIKELEGKFIRYDLTRFLRGKNMLIQLKVQIKEEGKDSEKKLRATSVAREIQILPCFLKRMVRKGTNYVEDSFSVNCRDAQLRIKPFLITRRKVSRAVRKALREKAREEITKYVGNKNSEEIFDDVLKNKLQKPLSLILKKIYPLSLCEIRMMKVEKELEFKKDDKSNVLKSEEKAEVKVKANSEKEKIKEKTKAKKTENIKEKKEELKEKDIKAKE